MSKPKRTTSDILNDIQATLKTAELGFTVLSIGLPQEKLSGLRNLIVFGRAVTNILQNLRSTEPDFDSWYRRYREEMESDSLLKFFYRLRSEILKEGSLKVSTHIFIRKLRFPQDLGRFPRPPNTKKFFVGDHIGGCGWEIELPDGSAEKYYVELPYDIGSVSLYFSEPPEFHLGEKITDSSIEALSALYLNYLRKVVKAAKEQFKQSPP